MEAKLLRVEKAAEVLGIGRAKTYQLIMSGKLRSVTIGRRRLVPADALERYIAELQGQATN